VDHRQCPQHVESVLLRHLPYEPGFVRGVPKRREGPLSQKRDALLLVALGAGRAVSEQHARLLPPERRLHQGSQIRVRPVLICAFALMFCRTRSAHAG
jgi:hypothetical protein